MKIFFGLSLVLGLSLPATWAQTDRPNILLAISDDQSYPHTSAYGSRFVQTPAFDRVANEGILFTQGFCASPGCSPSRAALLTGLNTWQLEHAGTHASYFDPKYRTYPDLLTEAGYHVGYTGKGWGPGRHQTLGRKTNPAGPSYQGQAEGGVSRYVNGFQKFMEARPEGQPFCFWFGSSDPHRSYEKGSGLAKGKSLDQVDVPAFLPDHPEIRSDLLDYAFEIERFDADLEVMLAILEERGELDNTLVIVTSDNGMPFPRAKANCYEYGIHMPLALRWGDRVNADRVVDDLVGFTDLTATIYEASGVEPPGEYPLEGRSLMPILKSDRSGRLDPSRAAIYAARERHSSSRYNSLSYPQRCLRTDTHLYIRNFKPERWPAGTPRKFASIQFNADGSVVTSKLGPEHGGYHDIDDCPALTFLINQRDDREIGRYLDLAVAKRPAEELFNIQDDPGCLINLAGQPEHAAILAELREQLFSYLKRTGDARVLGGGDVWETYPRTSPLRWFPTPDWAEENPDRIPEQPWLEERKPRG